MSTVLSVEPGRMNAARIDSGRMHPVRRPSGVNSGFRPSSAASLGAANTATARALPDWDAAESLRPDLEVVAGRAVRRARPRVVLASGVVAGVCAVLAGQLLLSIQTDASAFRLHALQSTSIALQREQQVQTEAVERLAAPQSLARAARHLGMVPTIETAYLRASDGQVVGSASPAGHVVVVGDSAVADALLPGH